MNGPISSNVMVNSIQNNAKYEMIQQSVDNSVNFINNNDGFTVVFWYTCGVGNDDSLTGVASGDDVTTDKAKLNYHIIDVYPTENDIMNPNTSIGMEYQELKLKMDHFHNI
jgi:hypothetical protein